VVGRVQKGSLVELDLTIFMSSLPERGKLRAQALDSIEEQTLKPSHLLWEIDRNRRGPVMAYNALAKKITTEWLFPFADDDLLDPNHFEILSKGLGPDVDIVYTWCRLTGRPDISETTFQIMPPEDYKERRKFYNSLKKRNFIPGCAAIRTSLWRKLDGYSEARVHEDWDFWVRALNLNAKFLCIPEVTWTYRIDPTWIHASGGKGVG
jgi:hypothetical protein